MYTEWFAGVNSPNGFYSHFDDIASDYDTRKIYIKGGSGMGKSSFMKRVAKKAEDEGLDYELFHCSSDYDSLDGINIPEIKVALVDATSPHISDPKFAGVTGTLLNTAEFLDGEKVYDKKEEINFFMEEKAKFFKRGYAYLESAQKLIKDTEKACEKEYNIKKVYKIQKELSKNIFKDLYDNAGKRRQLFLSAVCYDGVKNYLKKTFEKYSVTAIKGGAFTSYIIKQLAEEAEGRGFDTILCSCPMQPDKKYEHLLIPKLGIAVTTYNYYHHYQSKMYDLDEYACSKIPETAREEDYTEMLIKMASAQFERAKAAHRFIENFYVSAMDFDSLDKKFTQIINNIF